MDSTRILIVEDEGVLALDIGASLRRIGYDVTGTASSGPEAIDRADRSRPDVVLMDIQLHGRMDGVTAAIEIRRRFHIPTIFLTATADAETLQRAKAAEPIGFLVKPFDEDALHRAIQVGVHKHREQEERYQGVRHALREVETELGTFMNAVRDFGIFILDATGRIISWNIGAQRLNGYTSEEAVGMHVSTLYPVEEGGTSVVTDLLARAAADGEAVHEGWRVRKDGSRFWATVVVTALRDESGALRGFSSISRDITERKRLQDELRARALQQAAVARLGHSAVAGHSILRLCQEAVDLVRQCTTMERAAVLELQHDRAVFAVRARIGWSVAESGSEIPSTEAWETGFGANQSEALVIADFDTENRFTRSPFARVRGVGSAAVLAIRTDRQPFGVLAAYGPPNDRWSADDVAFLQSLADILAAAVRHQRAEDALRRSEHRFRLQSQRLPLPTYTWQKIGADFVLIDTNQAGEEFARGEINRFIGQRAATMYADRPDIVAMMNQAFDERRHVRHEIAYDMRSDATVRDLDVTYSYVPPEFVFVYIRDITEQRKNEQAILETHAQLRSLSSRLLIAQEDERKRIAREVHDELGQMLTAAKMNLSALELAIPVRDSRIDAQFARIGELIDEAIAGVRRITRELRPPVLDDFGLPAAIQFAADDFQRDTSIACEVSIRPDDCPADATTAIVLYRILQEALTNVARHSGATSVEVRLRSDERNLLLEVRDNGCGVDEAQVHNPVSLGLTGMRERAALVNGELRIEGVPGRGTIVSARIPVPAEKK